MASTTMGEDEYLVIHIWVWNEGSLPTSRKMASCRKDKPQPWHNESPLPREKDIAPLAPGLSEMNVTGDAINNLERHAR